MVFKEKVDELFKKILENKIEEAKLDPVGQEDDDIDNDGDVDSSDKYLKNRRKAIAKAMKKEDVEQIDEISKDKKLKYLLAINKGKQSLKSTQNQVNMAAARVRENPSDPAMRKRLDYWKNRLEKRKKGIERATNALTGKS